MTPGGPVRSSPTDEIAIADDLGPDALLDLAETWYREEHVANAEAACEAFDARYGTTELTPRQRGRRAELYGLASANNGELAIAELAWMSALDLFAAAGDEINRQITRSRIAQLMCRTDRAGFGLPIAEDATDYVITHGPIGRRASAYRRLAFCYMLGGRVEDALNTLDEAEPYAAVSDDTRTPMWLLVDRAGILGETGQIDAAHAAAEHARNACRSAGFRTGLAAASWISGRAHEIGGRLTDALAAYDEALGVCDDLEMRRQLRRQRGTLLAGTARATDAIGDLMAVADAAAAGDLPEAPRITSRTRTSTRTATGRRRRGRRGCCRVRPGRPGDESVRHLLAQAYRQLGQPDQAIEQLELIAASGAHRISTARRRDERADRQILDQLDRDGAAASRFAIAAELTGKPICRWKRYGRVGATPHRTCGRPVRLGGDALHQVDLVALASTRRPGSTLGARDAGLRRWPGHRRPRRSVRRDPADGPNDRRLPRSDRDTGAAVRRRHLRRSAAPGRPARRGRTADNAAWRSARRHSPASRPELSRHWRRSIVLPTPPRPGRVQLRAQPRPICHPPTAARHVGGSRRGLGWPQATCYSGGVTCTTSDQVQRPCQAAVATRSWKSRSGSLRPADITVSRWMTSARRPA